MKRWIHSSKDVKAGIGSGQRIIYYIGTYPDRKLFRTDGFQTDNFKTEEEAQAVLDEIYSEDYYRERYPRLQVLSRFAYNVYHA